MSRFAINKQSVLRVLLVVYMFLLLLLVFSLGVPPHDLPLCVMTFVLAACGFLLARRESKAWRTIWIGAVVVSVLCGALEVVAGHRIARQRPVHHSGLSSSSGFFIGCEKLA